MPSYLPRPELAEIGGKISIIVDVLDDSGKVVSGDIVQPAVIPVEGATTQMIDDVGSKLVTEFAVKQAEMQNKVAALDALRTRGKSLIAAFSSPKSVPKATLDKAIASDAQLSM